MMVKLKHNMIFGGVFYSFGDVLEREKIPPNLRKRKYLTEELVEEPAKQLSEEVDLDVLFQEPS
jgi:hypothetical protein